MKQIMGSSKLIPICRHAGDIVVDLKEFIDLGTDLTQEDVPQCMGTYTDNDGTVYSKNQQSISFGGVENEMSPLEAAHGAKMWDLTERGKRVSTHFTKNKSIMVESTEPEKENDNIRM